MERYDVAVVEVEPVVLLHYANSQILENRPFCLKQGALQELECFGRNSLL